MPPQSIVALQCLHFLINLCGTEEIYNCLPKLKDDDQFCTCRTQRNNTLCPLVVAARNFLTAIQRKNIERKIIKHRTEELCRCSTSNTCNKENATTNRTAIRKVHGKREETLHGKSMRNLNVAHSCKAPKQSARCNLWLARCLRVWVQEMLMPVTD